MSRVVGTASFGTLLEYYDFLVYVALASTLRALFLPEFDPFWEKVVEADTLVGMHSSDSGYDRFANEWMGNDSEMLPFQPQAFRMLGQWRPVEDAVSALICHGALSRFPQLKVAVIENGSVLCPPTIN